MMGLGLSRTAYNFIGGVMNAAQRALLDHQSHGQFLQAHQRAGHALGRDLVAQHGDLCRQQPHAYDQDPRQAAASSSASPTAPPIPISCPRRCSPPVSTALRSGIDPGKPLDIDMYAEGHKAPADTKKLPLNLLDALRLTRGLGSCCAASSATSSSTPTSSSRSASGTTIRASSPRGSAPTRSTARCLHARRGSRCNAPAVTAGGS